MLWSVRCVNAESRTWALDRATIAPIRLPPLGVATRLIKPVHLHATYIIGLYDRRTPQRLGRRRGLRRQMHLDRRPGRSYRPTYCRNHSEELSDRLPRERHVHPQLRVRWVGCGCYGAFCYNTFAYIPGTHSLSCHLGIAISHISSVGLSSVLYGVSALCWQYHACHVPCNSSCPGGHVLMNAILFKPNDFAYVQRVIV